MNKAGKIKESVKNIEDVIAIAKPSEEELSLINYSGTNSKMIGVKNALLLFLVSEVFNQGWEPDWNNTNQPKWYPWFNMKNGVGFSDSDYADRDAAPFVGSRLCFETEELSDLSAQMFPEIYKAVLTK